MLGFRPARELLDFYQQLIKPILLILICTFDFSRVQDSRERIPIEGKFGQGKNGYRLNYIRARRQKTSEAWINSIFLVMNLMVLLRKLYEKLKKSPHFDLFYLTEFIITRLWGILTRSSYPVPVGAWVR